MAMQDMIFIRVEEEQKELRAMLRDISSQLSLVREELAALKVRVTVLSAGGASLCAGLIWALQYLLTK
jgi:pantothenate kinase